MPHQRGTLCANMDQINTGVQRTETGAGRQASLGLRPAVVLSTLILPLCLCALIMVKWPPARVGDGTEYLLSMIALAESRTPYVTPEVISRYNFLIARRPLAAAFPVETAAFVKSGVLIPCRDGAYDTLHFWFLGLLAAPFYVIADKVGIHYANSFTLLNTFLLIVLLSAAYYVHRLYGVISVYVLCLFSPVLWFWNKGHTEYLTFAGVTVCSLFLYSGRLLPAGFALALVSTQNSALAPFSLAILCFWAFRNRRQKHALGTSAAFFGALALLALPPFYTWSKYGTLSNVLAGGFSRPDSVTLRKIISVFVDPDIGLYSNWSGGLLLLAAGAWLWGHRWHKSGFFRRDTHTPFFAFALAFVLLLPPIHASQPNFNSGGTVHVLRYATWYIGLHYVVVLEICKRLAELFQGRCYKLVIAAAAVALPFVIVNTLLFDPGNGETYLRFSPASLAIYNRLPLMYSPEPEIFIERATGVESSIPSAETRLNPGWVNVAGSNIADLGYWGVSTPSCKKVYVFAEMLRRPGTKRSLRPFGCNAPVDGGELFQRIQEKYGNPRDDYYAVLDAGTLQSALPSVRVCEPLKLYDPAASACLGRGWSAAEQAWRWSDGRQADLGFTVNRTDLEEFGSQRLGLRLESFAWAVPGTPQRARVTVNGQTVCTLQWRAPFQMQRDIIPIRADRDGRSMLEFTIEHPLPSAMIKPPDQRRLGMGVVTMELVPLDDPDRCSTDKSRDLGRR